MSCELLIWKLVLFSKSKKVALKLVWVACNPQNAGDVAVFSVPKNDASLSELHWHPVLELKVELELEQGASATSCLWNVSPCSSLSYRTILSLWLSSCASSIYVSKIDFSAQQKCPIVVSVTLNSILERLITCSSEELALSISKQDEAFSDMGEKWRFSDQSLNAHFPI